MKLVIIDDNEMLLKSLESFLSRSGHQCATFSDARRAIEVVRNGGGADVVLTDLLMPHMGGIEVLEQVKQIDSNIPVLVMTAYDQKEQELRNTYQGFDGFFRKPISLSDLLERLEFIQDVIRDR